MANRKRSCRNIRSLRPHPFSLCKEPTPFARHVEFFTEFTNLDGLTNGSKVRVEARPTAPRSMKACCN